MSSTLPNPGDREPVERESRTAGRPGPGQAARRAVALRYERGGAGAPRVVAKGEAPVAERILALADEHGVPKGVARGALWGDVRPARRRRVRVRRVRAA